MFELLYLEDKYVIKINSKYRFICMQEQFINKMHLNKFKRLIFFKKYFKKNTSFMIYD